MRGFFFFLIHNVFSWTEKIWLNMHILYQDIISNGIYILQYYIKWDIYHIYILFVKKGNRIKNILYFDVYICLK